MRLLMAAAVAGFAFAAAGQDAQNPVVAIVEGDPIYLEDVRQAARNLPPELGDLPFGMVFDRVLDRLIDVKLLAQAGRSQGLQNDPEVKAQIRGLTDRVIQEVVLTRAVEARITQDGLRRRYQDWLRANADQREALLRQILVGTERRARALLAEAQGGADFTALARDSSLGPEAAQGGDLGFVGVGDLPDAVIEAALATPPGALASDPVRSVFGWHVLRVEEIRRKVAPTFIEARPFLVQQWSSEIIADTVKRLRGGASIDIYDVTPGDQSGRSSADPRFSASPGDRSPGDQSPGDQSPGDQSPGDQSPGDQSDVIQPGPDVKTADALGGVFRALAERARDLVVEAQIAIPEAASGPKPALARPAAGLGDPRRAEGPVVAIAQPDRAPPAPFAPPASSPKPTPAPKATDSAAPLSVVAPSAGVAALLRAELFTPDGARAPERVRLTTTPRPGPQPPAMAPAPAAPAEAAARRDADGGVRMRIPQP